MCCSQKAATLPISVVPQSLDYEEYTENGKVRQQATVPGSTQYWKLNFPKAGTYKVVLSCVDYYGNIINKVHTVTVK